MLGFASQFSRFGGMSVDQNVLVENLSQVNVEICAGVQKLFCCPSFQKA